MDELVMVMKDVLSELQNINEKLDEIRGDGLYNSLSDVCNKLDSIERSVDAVDTTIFSVH